MDTLYGQALDYLRALRAAGRPESAEEILHAFMDGCGHRELLNSLRYTLAELPTDAELGPELAEGRAKLLDELERCWRELPG